MLVTSPHLSHASGCISRCRGRSYDRSFDGVRRGVRGEHGIRPGSDLRSSASFCGAALTSCTHAPQGAVACAVQRLQHDLDGLDAWQDGQDHLQDELRRHERAPHDFLHRVRGNAWHGHCRPRIEDDTLATALTPLAQVTGGQLRRQAGGHMLTPRARTACGSRRRPQGRRTQKAAQSRCLLIGANKSNQGAGVAST